MLETTHSKVLGTCPPTTPSARSGRKNSDVRNTCAATENCEEKYRKAWKEREKKKRKERFSSYISYYKKVNRYYDSDRNNIFLRHDVRFSGYHSGLSKFQICRKKSKRKEITYKA